MLPSNITNKIGGYRMKKIVATFLGICLLLLSSFNVRADDTTQLPDGKLTLAVLEKMSSWEELYNTVHPISDDILDTIENKEDYYCVLLIEGINQKKIIPYSHNEEYVSFSLDIEFKDIEIKRFLLKIKKIINIYNDSSKTTRIYLEHLPLNRDYMQIRINSVNALTRSATQVGQKVLPKDYAVFYESAYGGSHIKMKDSSSVPEDCIVKVNGYVYYEDVTRHCIQKVYYVPFNELAAESEPRISHRQPRMYHVCTQDTDLGWVNVDDIIRVN